MFVLNSFLTEEAHKSVLALKGGGGGGSFHMYSYSSRALNINGDYNEINIYGVYLETEFYSELMLEQTSVWLIQSWFYNKQKQIWINANNCKD